MYIFGGKRITNLENIIEKIIKTISGHTHSIIGRESILVEFVIIDSNLIFVPTPKGLKLKKNEESPLINTTYYQKFIDKMIYLLNLRLDLLYAT
uniref:Uncharacterized protein n=1 Tax=Physcomitrium patens TaxID=3218 RepID=A0A2K1JGP6_PHYPA|nr:hypothetical protein PHYPA_018138 [Physcomitrium patens]